MLRYLKQIAYNFPPPPSNTPMFQAHIQTSDRASYPVESSRLFGSWKQDDQDSTRNLEYGMNWEADLWYSMSVVQFVFLFTSFSASDLPALSRSTRNMPPTEKPPEAEECASSLHGYVVLVFLSVWSCAGFSQNIGPAIW